MSDILVTHPGMFGDALWALPTARAIAQTYQTPVDLCLSADFGTPGFLELLKQAPYLNEVWAEDDWHIQATAPLTPRRPPRWTSNDLGGYKRIIHLGLAEWPRRSIPLEIYDMARSYVSADVFPAPLDLSDPWLKVHPEKHADVVIGWNPHWLELKMGVAGAVAVAFEKENVSFTVLNWEGSRIDEWGVPWMKLSWLKTAEVIAGAKVFMGCLSAPWVMANALGKPTVVVEPAEARHNPIFYLDAPRNHMVIGGDGKPTFDAREVVQMLRKVLEEVAR